MTSKNLLWGKPYMDKMHAMPFYHAAHKVTEAMLLNGVTTEQLLDFTGLTDHEFARLLAGDGTYAAADYEVLINQIKLHGHNPVQDANN